MINFLKSLKSKALGILCIILITALTISVMEGNSSKTELTSLRTKYNEQVSLNERLSNQNLDLLDEIDKRPIEFINIVKEVQVEICNGRVQQELINALPSKKGNVNAEKDQANTADIDDRLPDDLLRLLK